MSLVGPRPELRRYVEMFRTDYETLLQVRPGVTDPASLVFRHESEILGRAENPDEEYTQRILPAKIKLAKDYVQRSSLCLNLSIMAKTALLLVRDRLPL